MANDHHQAHERHQAGSSSTTTITTTAAAAFPPPAHALPLHTAQPPGAGSSSQPLAATHGPDAWGGGTDGASPFGLGPLALFRHAPKTALEEATGPSPPHPPLTGRQLVEMDRLMRTDPVSFNPLQAISWARLDDAGAAVGGGEPAPGEGMATPPKGSRKGEGKGKARDGEARGQGARQHGEHGFATGAAAYQHPHPQIPYHQQQVELALSPVRNMARTSSHMDMASAYVPPLPAVTAAPPPTSMMQPRAGSAAPPPTQGRQKRKHRHRHEKMGGASPPDGYLDHFPQQQQQQGYPPHFPASSTPAPLAAQQHPYPSSQQQYQAAFTAYPLSSSASSSSTNTNTRPQHPYAPAQQRHEQNAPLLLCLAPACQARFPSSAQLQAHYQTAHQHHQNYCTTANSTNDYNNNGSHQHPENPDTTTTHVCSWTACKAAGFTSNNALVWHVKAEHLLLCPVPGCCDRAFSSRKQVEGHVRNKDV